MTVTLRFSITVVDGLNSHGAGTFTRVGGVASRGAQLALQPIYFLRQRGIGEQEPGHLELKLGRVLVHQLADLTQGRPGHRLYDGAELRVQREAARHSCDEPPHQPEKHVGLNCILIKKGWLAYKWKRAIAVAT